MRVFVKLGRRTLCRGEAPPRSFALGLREFSVRLPLAPGVIQYWDCGHRFSSASYHVSEQRLDPWCLCSLLQGLE
ncbi:hypothetical protein WJX73_007022 [Symbiochloris irregularis]|uniref:Uncharacterized protein n=1 Tax=Symbiochloris irregularis TaxID=706552 RepID=A0AAW1PQA8_9CHLO